jgi:hypothetical protein
VLAGSLFFMRTSGSRPSQHLIGSNDAFLKNYLTYENRSGYHLFFLINQVKFSNRAVLTNVVIINFHI